MDQTEGDKRNEIFVFNNDGSNAINVTQEQPLNVPWDAVNVVYNYTNDLAVNDNILPAPHATTPMNYDFATQSSCNEYYRNNSIAEQVSIQNPLQFATSSLPDNSFNPSQIPINYSEIFRFVIPGFQIVVIPTSSPFADLNDFDIQYQFQPGQAFSSFNSSQLNQDVSGAYETSGSGNSSNIDQSQYQPNSGLNEWQFQ